MKLCKEKNFSLISSVFLNYMIYEFFQIVANLKKSSQYIFKFDFI